MAFNNLKILLDYVWNVELYQFGLELFGLWPKANEGARNKFCSYLRLVFTFVLMIFLILIPILCALIRVWGNMILMIENLQISLPLLMMLLNIFVMRCKRKVVLSILKMMEEDWMKPKEDAERDVMIRRARTARLIIICGYTIVILACITIIVFPLCGIPHRNLTNLTDRNRQLPLQAYYFYDTDNSPQYEFTFIAQALGALLGSLTYATINAFFGLVVFHICAQLENFKRRLSYMIAYKDFKSALRDNVEAHLRLIRFANNIEDTFDIILLGVVMFFGISFCMYGFILFTVLIDKSNNMSFSQLCFPIMGGIILIAFAFLYCGAGEIVTYQGESVYRTICDLEWYNLESRNAKVLILLMLQASESFCITAGKIVPLTLATFCTMLKSSAGYISLLVAKRN